ncbi:MAG: response regulator [Pseudomonadota bacterium]
MNRLKDILVVDDEVGIRNLLFDVLSNEGFRVTLAKDGKESLGQLRKHRFDLLITDINMPRLDGIELLKKMKKAGRMERVILMSGRPVDTATLEKDAPPIFTMLEKPFHIHDFLDVVTSALAKPMSKKGSGGRVGINAVNLRKIRSPTPSPRRKPGSRKERKDWIPAFAGMTSKASTSGPRSLS